MVRDPRTKTYWSRTKTNLKTVRDHGIAITNLDNLERWQHHNGLPVLDQNLNFLLIEKIRPALSRSLWLELFKRKCLNLYFYATKFFAPFLTSCDHTINQVAYVGFQINAIS